ncbi:MAG: 50S ribosomal protein L6 [Planctomycetia bacterium]
MSRIGQKPVAVPAGVKIQVTGQTVKAEGPKGSLAIEVDPLVTIEASDGSIVCRRDGDERKAKSLHGLYRNLIKNMIEGVHKGFERKLEIVGVGYNAVLSGTTLSLTVGFSQPQKLTVPAGVKITLPDVTHIVVSGSDKQKVGQFAAEIRQVRKPEPYKGTGIRYDGEQVRRKAGKAMGSGS